LKRAVAQALFYLSCLSGSAATSCFGADLNSSWQPLGQAKIKKNIRATLPFRPELTLEQNNQNLQDHRTKSVIVSSTVPTKSLRSIQLVNHTARLQIDDQSFSGRVTAVMLSGDQQSLTVFAEISGPLTEQQNLSERDAGLLSVED
jgi:hypothetical protein